MQVTLPSAPHLPVNFTLPLVVVRGLLSFSLSLPHSPSLSPYLCNQQNKPWIPEVGPLAVILTPHLFLICFYMKLLTMAPDSSSRCSRQGTVTASVCRQLPGKQAGEDQKGFSSNGEFTKKGMKHADEDPRWRSIK